MPAPTWTGGVQQANLGIGPEPDDVRTRSAEFGSDLAQLRVHPSRLLVVRQNADPVGLGAEVVGVPVPVLDHFRAAGDECPRCLSPLPVVRREVDR